VSRPVRPAVSPGWIEVYSNPRRGEHRSSQVLKPGQDVSLAIDGAVIGRIAVADLLP
jgi:hypothetical protein